MRVYPKKSWKASRGGARQVHQSAGSKQKKTLTKHCGRTILQKLTVKFLWSELNTLSLTVWSPLRLPHFIVFASNTASPFWALLVSSNPQEDGVQDRLSVVLSGVLFPELSQTKACTGALRKQLEKSLALCSCFCDGSSNAWLLNSIWCGAPEII